jgi:hypothetical protein
MQRRDECTRRSTVSGVDWLELRASGTEQVFLPNDQMIQRVCHGATLEVAHGFVSLRRWISSKIKLASPSSPFDSASLRAHSSAAISAARMAAHVAQFRGSQ